MFATSHTYMYATSHTYMYATSFSQTVYVCNIIQSDCICKRLYTYMYATSFAYIYVCDVANIYVYIHICM